ncbi:MAG TPA: polyhydroxyalkanoate synthesis regulator DNA-binding domain-containing protein [Tepidisphaeraceae bacterium]|jgi:polyhydroxyalkanoate synthesis repressor PhaR
MADQPTGGGFTRRIEIRRYPNRRYYDTSQSRYLTLQELYDLIRDGAEVRVTDSKSGQDITAKVLAQIIIELDPPKLDVFPVPLLHRLIRANEKIVNDFVDKYFNQALATFLDSQRKFEQSFRQAIGLEPPPMAAMVPEWMKMMWGPLMPPFWSRNGGPVGGGAIPGVGDVPLAPPRRTAPESADAPANPSEESPGTEGNARPPQSVANPSAEASGEAVGPTTAASGATAAEAAGELREVVDELRRQIALLREQVPNRTQAATPPPTPPRRSAKKRR